MGRVRGKARRGQRVEGRGGELMEKGHGRVLRTLGPEGGQAAGMRDRGGDGARTGRLALMCLRGASTELDIYLQYYLY